MNVGNNNASSNSSSKVKVRVRIRPFVPSLDESVVSNSFLAAAESASALTQHHQALAVPSVMAIGDTVVAIVDPRDHLTISGGGGDQRGGGDQPDNGDDAVHFSAADSMQQMMNATLTHFKALNDTVTPSASSLAPRGDFPPSPTPLGKAYSPPPPPQHHRADFSSSSASITSPPRSFHSPRVNPLLVWARSKAYGGVAATAVSGSDGGGNGSYVSAVGLTPAKSHQAPNLRKSDAAGGGRSISSPPPLPTNNVASSSASLLGALPLSTTHAYAFDGVHAADCTQDDVFEDAGMVEMLDEALEGRGAKSTVLSYGATGTGKTHTITGKWGRYTKATRGNAAKAGDDDADAKTAALFGPEAGLLPRTLHALITYQQSQREDKEEDGEKGLEGGRQARQKQLRPRRPRVASVSLCAVELYLDLYYDLLTAKRTAVFIRDGVAAAYDEAIMSPITANINNSSGNTSNARRNTTKANGKLPPSTPSTMLEISSSNTSNARRNTTRANGKLPPSTPSNILEELTDLSRAKRVSRLITTTSSSSSSSTPTADKATQSRSFSSAPSNTFTDANSTTIADELAALVAESRESARKKRVMAAREVLTKVKEAPPMASRCVHGVRPSVVTIESLSDIAAVFKRITSSRTTSSNTRNDQSSRSHALYIVRIDFDGGGLPPSFIVFVDLAGSERFNTVDHYTVVGLQESIFINKSLAALSTVVSALASSSASSPQASNAKRNVASFDAPLTSPSHPLPPFRNSRLTRLLRPCFESSSSMLCLIHLSPFENTLDETLASIRFAEQLLHVTPTCGDAAVDASRLGERRGFLATGSNALRSNDSLAVNSSTRSGDSILTLRSTAQEGRGVPTAACLAAEAATLSHQHAALCASVRLANAEVGYVPRRLGHLLRRKYLENIENVRKGREAEEGGLPSLSNVAISSIDARRVGRSPSFSCASPPRPSVTSASPPTSNVSSSLRVGLQGSVSQRGGGGVSLAEDSQQTAKQDTKKKSRCSMIQASERAALDYLVSLATRGRNGEVTTVDWVLRSKAARGGVTRGPTGSGVDPIVVTNYGFESPHQMRRSQPQSIAALNAASPPRAVSYSPSRRDGEHHHLLTATLGRPTNTSSSDYYYSASVANEECAANTMLIGPTLVSTLDSSGLVLSSGGEDVASPNPRRQAGAAEQNHNDKSPSLLHSSLGGAARGGAAITNSSHQHTATATTNASPYYTHIESCITSTVPCSQFLWKVALDDSDRAFQRRLVINDLIASLHPLQRQISLAEAAVADLNQHCRQLALENCALMARNAAEAEAAMSTARSDIKLMKRREMLSVDVIALLQQRIRSLKKTDAQLTEADELLNANARGTFREQNEALAAEVAQLQAEVDRLSNKEGMDAVASLVPVLIQKLEASAAFVRAATAVVPVRDALRRLEFEDHTARKSRCRADAVWHSKGLVGVRKMPFAVDSFNELIVPLYALGDGEEGGVTYEDVVYGDTASLSETVGDVEGESSCAAAGEGAVLAAVSPIASSSSVPPSPPHGSMAPHLLQQQEQQQLGNSATEQQQQQQQHHQPTTPIMAMMTMSSSSNNAHQQRQGMSVTLPRAASASSFSASASVRKNSPNRRPGALYVPEPLGINVSPRRKPPPAAETPQFYGAVITTSDSEANAASSQKPPSSSPTASRTSPFRTQPNVAGYPVDGNVFAGTNPATNANTVTVNASPVSVAQSPPPPLPTSAFLDATPHVVPAAPVNRSLVAEYAPQPTHFDDPNDGVSPSTPMLDAAPHSPSAVAVQKRAPTPPSSRFGGGGRRGGGSEPFPSSSDASPPPFSGSVAASRPAPPTRTPTPRRTARASLVAPSPQQQQQQQQAFDVTNTDIAPHTANAEPFLATTSAELLYSGVNDSPRASAPPAVLINSGPASPCEAPTHRIRGSSSSPPPTASGGGGEAVVPRRVAAAPPPLRRPPPKQSPSEKK